MDHGQGKRVTQGAQDGGLFHVTHRCHIELNMVRCGLVAHPKEWDWVGYHEIMGEGRRYRLIDLERLCWQEATIPYGLKTDPRTCRKSDS